MEEKIKEEVFKLMKRHEIEDDRLQAMELTQNTIVIIISSYII